MSKESKMKIYTFWYQGFENAPDIVKICHNSLTDNIDKTKQDLICIDKTNLLTIVDLPNCVIDKFQRGIISLTHFSDIVRTALLEKTGGIWVDATMLITKPINNDISSKVFFTIKNPLAKENSITSRWESFFIAGKAKSPMFSMLKEFWFEYWKKENMLLDYLLIDHIFYIGYMIDQDIKESVDNCPEFYYRIDYFQNIINSPYNKEKLEEIVANEPYLKLTYKNDLNEKTKDGQLTYYGWLKERYLDENNLLLK